MNERQFAAVDALIRETADQIILPRFRKLASGDVREKAPGDYVTIVDTEAETMLAAGLQAIQPGSQVVGEEGVSKRATDLARLGSEAPVWLIDPLDGTGNFVQGIPRFATMVALVQRKEIIAGWIFDPVAGWMAHTESGGGAWQDEVRLRVRLGGDEARKYRVNRQLIRRLGAANVPSDFESFTYRCAGQEYMALASGAADYGLYTRLMPWDHAAGVLLHREAGGTGRMVGRAAYDVTVSAGLLLLAPDEGSWERLETLLPKH